ncbi:hypothetical protein ABBQ38_014661 [Trebouxia sp. C0009 RCD-2024]
MVKTRKDNSVVTALPVSKPADVPVVSALAEESIPDKAPQPSPSSPSTSGAEANSRPVRVYADGQQLDVYAIGYTWVDEVVKDAPWVLDIDFINKHKIDFVTHDALPYSDASGQANDVYDFVKKLGKFKETQRTDGVSTSDIILRIIKDYNDFVMRNLKRGYSRKELGLSFVKEKQIRGKQAMKQLGDRMRDQRVQVADRVRKHVSAARILPKVDMEKNVKEFAAGVEQLVDRIVSGELGVDLAQNADKYMSGFIKQFEDGYSKIEQAVRTKFLPNSRRAKSAKIPKAVKTVAMKKKGKSLLNKSTSITEAVLSRAE